MAGVSGKSRLRLPTALVLDGIDDHDVVALRSRLTWLSALIETAGPGVIKGDQAGRSWQFDLAGGTRLILSTSRTLTSLDVSPLTGAVPFGLWMEIQNEATPSDDGLPELRDVVIEWGRWLTLPRRMRRSSVQGPSEEHRRIAAVVSALLTVHGDNEPGGALASFGDLTIQIRPASVGAAASIKDGWSNRDMLSAGLTEFLVRDLPVEACLSLDAKQRRYMVGDTEAESTIQTSRTDALEAMRLIADLPTEFHAETCIAVRFRP